MLVFCPVSKTDLRTWARGTRPAGDAYAATRAFVDAFGLSDAPDTEDAERTLLYIAGLDALLRFGERIVAVAEATAFDTGSEFGLVGVGPLAFSSVTALFADSPESAAAVAEAREQLGGQPVALAWDQPVHERLLADVDLLWFGSEEWSALTEA